MQTLSLFPTPLFTNKQASTFKVSAAREGVSTFTAPSRLLQDTVSFSATPKIRSGATADRQLSELEIQLLTETLEPYQSGLSEPNAPFSVASLKKALKKELPSFFAPAYADADAFVTPTALMAKLFSDEDLRANARNILQLRENHPALNDNPALLARQARIAEVQQAYPASPSDPLLNGIFQQDPDKKTQFLTAYNGPTIESKQQAANYLLEAEIPDKDWLKASISQFKINVDEWVKEVDWAKEQFRQETNVQIRLHDLATFRKIAEKAGLLEAFDGACTEYFASTLRADKARFSLAYQTPIAQYARMLEKITGLKRELVPASLVDYEFFGLFKAVFSKNRQKNVKQVLNLLKTKPQAVEAVIQKLKAVKA